MKPRFTERDTELFYDSEDELYRSFWDEAGSLHWGVFDEHTGSDFLRACANLNHIMTEKGRIDHNSKVLDLGCGNGNTALWLCESQGSWVTGIDLSGVRVGNALGSLARQPDDVKSRLAFKRAFATDLPFDDGTFTHVWSQAAIYHVHDKRKVLQETYRVLGKGGVFVFDDLIKPKPNISEMARQFVYDRLLFDTDFTFDSYQGALRGVGFRVLEAYDLSQHLKTSYQCLAAVTRGKIDRDPLVFQPLSVAYDQMVQWGARLGHVCVPGVNDTLGQRGGHGGTKSGAMGILLEQHGGAG